MPKAILVIILLLLGVSGYLLWTNNNQGPAPITQQTQSSPTATSPRENEIKVSPINGTNFEKSVVEADNCGNPVGMVSYHDKVSDSYMKINSNSLPGNADSRKGLDDISAFLSGKKLGSFENIRSFEMAFRDYCGGHYTYFIKELSNIQYPNTDSVKTLMAYTGQDMYGNVEVMVLAKKGDELIYLSKYFLDQPLYTKHQQDCDNPQNGEASEKCYKEAIRTDAALESLARQETSKLISLFAI